MLPVTEIPDRIFILPGFYVYKDHESLVVVCVLEKRRAPHGTNNGGDGFQESTWGKSRSTVTSSKLEVDFKTNSHRGFFVVTAKSAGKRARSVARRRLVAVPV
jgi:hypothetical protein